MPEASRDVVAQSGEAAADFGDRFGCPAACERGESSEEAAFVGLEQVELHSKAARSVWWRGGAVRRPRVRSEKRSVSPSSTPMIGRSPSAAAASSIASGIPFSWATMRATSPAFSSVSSNCGLTERARSTNRRTASAAAASSAPSIPSGSTIGNGLTRHTTSPSMSSGSVLVARITR